MASLRCLVLMLLAAPSTAATLDQHTFDFIDGHARYRFSATLAAPPDDVYRVLTAPELLGRINAGIRNSEIIARESTNQWTRRVLMQQCVIGICFDLQFVEHVEATGDGILELTQVRNAGSFREGRARWQVGAVAANTTRLTMEADQVPSFWIPPVIGPFLMRRAFLREVGDTILRIEAIARHETVR